MYDFLDVVLAVFVILAPHDARAVEMWPYAADADKEKSALVLTYRRDGNRWCNYGDCATIVDGKLLDENGRALLDVKANLTADRKKMYTLQPKDWDNPLVFSVREHGGERTMSIYEGGHVVRQIRVKLWETDPPVEFAFCGPKQTNDLAALRTQLLAGKIYCTEIRSAPKAVSFGFSVNIKDFARARTAAVGIIARKSLSVDITTDINGNGCEMFEHGVMAGRKDF